MDELGPPETCLPVRVKPTVLKPQGLAPCRLPIRPELIKLERNNGAIPVPYSLCPSATTGSDMEEGAEMQRAVPVTHLSSCVLVQGCLASVSGTSPAG